ncbi:MAG: sulfite exporter TauE/SafE family protein [Proteobacteria bacterium]|nr:sulfite exporter TauE/SafE family protein [Pseudomonadota bacterium]
MNWLNTAAGFGVGVMVGMTGVGGGALMTPILVLLFGIAPTSAVGTDLWFAALTKIVGGSVHQKRGGVDWSILRLLWLGSLPASIVTLLWLRYSGNGEIRHGFIVTALGAVLVLTALAMLFKKQMHALGQRLRIGAPDGFRHAQPPLTVAAGVILGVLVTLTSVGAGALGTVMLLYLYPLRLTPSKLVGTDIVHAIPLTIVAGIGHLLMGNVNPVLLGSLLLGSIPGVLLGAFFSARAPEKLLRSTIAVVLVMVGAKLLAS